MAAAERPENETLRWPTNLDHAAIVQRLVQVRQTAMTSNLPAIAELFSKVESFNAAQIGQAVIAAMNQVQENPEHSALALQLAMVAMNLKNLR